MYNGIGLSTVRGSGTSGYVTANKFSGRRRRRDDRRRGDWREEKGPTPNQHGKKPNAGILEHERKRKVEVQLLELRVELEDAGAPDAEIERRVGEERARLLAAPAPAEKRAEKRSRSTHQRAYHKGRQMDTLGRALGLRDVVEGDAFDRELQEKRKQQRIAEREERERERKAEQERRRREAAETKKRDFEKRRRRRDADEANLKVAEDGEIRGADGGPARPRVDEFEEGQLGPSPGRRGGRSPSPRRRGTSRGKGSASPPRRGRGRSRSRSRSRSRGSSYSYSSYSYSYSDSRSRSRSRTPPSRGKGRGGGGR